MSHTAQPGAVPAPVNVLSRASNHTHGQILKSSVLIGGASVINMGLLAVRTKVMAVLLGATGYGLMDLYWTIAELSRTVAGMGINNSGVRQIAEAVGTGDDQRIARTVITLRRVSLILGALGALLLVALCKPVSWFAFRDGDHAGSVALLALAVFFGAVTAGQMALVQGMRRIADLARINILGALYGTLFSIPIVYFLREQGVVPSLICVAGMSIVTSWWYSRKVKVVRVHLTTAEVRQETSGLLKLGVVFMASVPMAMGATFLIKVIVKRAIGSEALGYYQAAWQLSGVYVMFILQAMGTDFFPRLTAAARDHAECNRLVNEQAEVGLLMAGPGVMGTLTLAPLVIHVFYTAEFAPAVEILRWNCLGMLLRVASWPMSYTLLAKGARGLYFWSELASNALQIGLVWACVQGFGLKGTGIAFFTLAVCYWCAMYVIVRSLTGFRWSAMNKRVGLLFATLFAVVFGAWYVLPPMFVVALGTVLSLAVGYYSLKTICRLVPLDRLPRLVRSLLRVLKLTPTEPTSPS